MQIYQNPPSVLFLVSKSYAKIEAPFRIELFDNDVRITIADEDRNGKMMHNYIGVVSRDPHTKKCSFEVNRNVPEKIFLNEKQVAPGCSVQILDGSYLMIGDYAKYYYMEYDNWRSPLSFENSDTVFRRHILIGGGDSLSDNTGSIPQSHLKCSVCSCKMPNIDLIDTTCCKPCVVSYGATLAGDLEEQFKRGRRRTIATIIDEIAVSEFKNHRTYTF